ncbi:hypothetical protein TNCV_2190541 [Trichonephila clavipes]|uniref:Uncharacterized protein n=1 Tax=Trichonephila clavipes TaxID=2585209 RepID=A0A8X6UU52_TRICX|nr:hypothetical protein TNCV_2190541 [Trichonephila clavipes]
MIPRLERQNTDSEFTTITTWLQISSMDVLEKEKHCIIFHKPSIVLEYYEGSTSTKMHGEIVYRKVSAHPNHLCNEEKNCHVGMGLKYFFRTKNETINL